MADGFRLDIDGDRAAKLKAAADARGVDPAEFALQLLSYALVSVDDTGGPDVDLTDDVESADEFERTRMGIPHEDVAAWLQSLHSKEPLPKPKRRKID